MIDRRTILAASLGLPLAALAQSKYPGRPVSIVVGFSPGGSTDILARLVAKELGSILGGNFIVENKPGANSNIANAFVARSAPDGANLLMIPFGLPVNQYLYQQPGYDYARDISPIALVAKVPNAIIVAGNSRINTVKDYLAAAAANKHGLTYSSPGVGSSLHLAGELFRYESKANVLHIPYKGSAPALAAVMSGECDSAFDNLSTAAPFVQSGRLKIIAVTSKVRSPAFPNIPTVAESGLPKYEISSYFGLGAPAATPKSIIDTLNKAVMTALGKSEIKTYLDGLGAIVEPNSPAQFASFLQHESDKWGAVISAAGITPN